MSGRMIAMEDGTFVNERVSFVVQAIRDYDPNIEVQWVPPRARDKDTAAFRLVHNEPGKEPYTIFYVKDEREFDVRVLKRLIANDHAKNGAMKYSEVEAFEEAQKRLVQTAYRDKIEEANDIAAHVFRSHKNTYKVSDDLIIKDFGSNKRRGRPTNYANEHRRRFL